MLGKKPKTMRGPDEQQQPPSGSHKALDKESEKRLKDFFSKKAVLEKRWRSFQSWREFKADAPVDVASFFEDNFYMVFTLLQDAVVDFGAQALKGKRDPRYLEQIVWLLGTVVDNLGTLINRGWQTKALHDIVCNLLYRENKLELRLRGLEIYLAFMSALRPVEQDWPQHKDTLSLLGQCLYFQPYVGAGEAVKFAVNPLEAPPDAAVWQPGGTVNEADADVYLKKLFDFVSSKSATDEFGFWFSMLKLNVLSVMYPKVFQQMKLLPEGQNTGFPECPAKLQRLLHSYLAVWMGDRKNVGTVWGNPQNAQLLLDVFANALSLSTTATDVSILALQTFHGLFFTASPVHEVESRITPYRLYFLKKLPTVFVKPTDPGTLTQHCHLCREATRLVMEAGKLFGTLEKQVNDVILALPLNALTALFSGRTSSELAVEIARDLVQATIRLWVIAQPDVSWKALQNVMAFVFGESAAAIDMVRDLLLQMTLILQRFYYPSRTVKESKRIVGAEGQRTAGQISRAPDWRTPREAPDADPEFEQASWTPKTALATWQNVRDLFSRMNTIADPAHHAKAAEALVYVSDYLLQQDAGVPYEALAQPNQLRPLELIDVLGPLLCDAVLTPSEAFDAGRAVAMGGLCRLFCRQTDPVPLAVLRYVYAVVARELDERPLAAPAAEVLANTSGIFTLALPGVMALIPSYLSAIKALVDAPPPSLDAATVRGCITIVASLVCFPAHFKNTLSIPRPKGNPLTGKELFAEVTALLNKLLSPAGARFVGVGGPEHTFMVLCALVTYIMNEAHVGTRIEDLGVKSQVSVGMRTPRVGESRADVNTTNFIRKQVGEYVTAIVQRLCHPSDDVAVGASHCMATLAMDHEALGALDSALVAVAIQGIANAIVAFFREGESDKKWQLRPTVVIAALEALEEWVLAVPSVWLAQPAINAAVFAAVEVTLFGAAERAGQSKKWDLAVLRATPAHGSKEVAEVAEVLLRSMLSLQNQWPGPGGAELTGTTLRESEAEDAEHRYYFANGSLVSLVPLPNKGGGVRMFIRDESDRYAWDARVEFGDAAVQNAPALALGAPAGASFAVPSSSKKYQRQPKQPPSFVPDEDAIGVDKVEETLRYLSEVYDDCPYEPDAIAIAPEIKPLVEETLRCLDKQEAVMASYFPKSDAAADHPLAVAVANPPTDPLHHSRLLLSHLNMVDYDQRAHFAMLESGTPLQRSVNTLDTKKARETFKVGLIYVRHGQDSEGQILRNEVRSQHYDAFVQGLAWEVDMATHRGYTGGLDTTKFLTGAVAPYYSTPRLELMFHDVTLMPNTKDDQQIHKKRHVGNDVVNVVWSEHVRDYDPSTISTQFNCAHVICYPQPNGLVRVQICRKEEQVFPLFGPLLHNTVVTPEILTILARQACLNANRNFTSHKAGYLMPFPNRRKDVEQLLSRYRSQESSDFAKTVCASFTGM